MVTDPTDPATSKGIGLRPQIVHLLLFGLSGPWRFYEEAVSAASRDVRFQLSRTFTFNTNRNVDIIESEISRSILSCDAYRRRLESLDEREHIPFPTPYPTCSSTHLESCT